MQGVSVFQEFLKSTAYFMGSMECRDTTTFLFFIQQITSTVIGQEIGYSGMISSSSQSTQQNATLVPQIRQFIF
jgi:hypothetical protein